MKKPIEVLNAASQKIAENDLGFTVEVPCGNELGRLCGSFEKMRAALLELNREHWAQMEERRRLNAAFAHDLRTPLTVLRGRATLLEMCIRDRSISAMVNPSWSARFMP